MAIYKIFPTKDTTLYSEFKSTNTGLDEIIEVSSYLKEDTPQVSRYLIKFSSTEMADVIDNKIGAKTWSAYLKTFAADITGLNLESKLYFYPASGSWGMGTGHFNDSPLVDNGAGWVWRTYSGSNQWNTSGFGNYATGSYPSTNPGGGTWYTGSALGLNVVHTQSFTYSDNIDTEVDVTTTIHTWDSGGLANEGFLVKNQDSSEFVDNRNNDSYYKFFSIDTHTIYPPQLEFRWNDYIFNTGSSTNSIITTPSSFISIYNNVETYYSGSISKMRFAVVPKYPTRQFQTSSLYTTNYYLPEDTSLYAIKDTYTNEMIIDFDEDYTKIGADATSSYFKLYLSGFEPERHYSVLVKTIIDGDTIIYDEDITFKVEESGIVFGTRSLNP
jgi:hypothetical protein